MSQVSSAEIHSHFPSYSSKFSECMCLNLLRNLMIAKFRYQFVAVGYCRFPVRTLAPGTLLLLSLPAHSLSVSVSLSLSLSLSFESLTAEQAAAMTWWGLCREAAPPACGQNGHGYASAMDNQKQQPGQPTPRRPGHPASKKKGKAKKLNISKQKKKRFSARYWACHGQGAGT